MWHTSVLQYYYEQKDTAHNLISSNTEVSLEFLHIATKIERLWNMREEKKKINTYAMSFKSLINIRSICPLAETEKPINANEWESKAIRVHYRVPLVSTAVSLGLSTAGHADPNWKCSMLYIIDGTHVPFMFWENNTNPYQ